MITRTRTNIISENRKNYRYIPNLKSNNKIKARCKDFINENVKEFFCVMILFLIGIIASIIFVNHTNEVQQNEISQYFSDYITSVKERKENR